MLSEEKNNFLIYLNLYINQGMCNNCYHSNGRNKKSWKCVHVERPHYALGVCQTCYQLKYNSKPKKDLEEIVNSSNKEEEENETKSCKPIN